MFENPDIARQLVDDRHDRWQREAAAHRITGPAKRRLRDRLRTPRVSFIARRPQIARGAKPATT
jgi:hypothetical protein